MIKIKTNPEEMYQMRFESDSLRATSTDQSHFLCYLCKSLKKQEKKLECVVQKLKCWYFTQPDSFLVRTTHPFRAVKGTWTVGYAKVWGIKALKPGVSLNLNIA